MTHASESDFDALLAHSGWARSLARHLVRDAHAADDLVQRAWVAALESPPAAEVPPRRWLASVLRNLARRDARDGLRRTEREAAHAASESHRDLTLEGIGQQEKLLAVLRQLAQPYRSTIYARYFEGLQPREIARRTHVPLKTVKTRLARGLEELRARLDREHGGDRRAWVALFLPLAKPPLHAALIGALLVNAKVKLACALAAVAIAVVISLEFAGGEAAHPTRAAAEANAPSTMEPPRSPADATHDERLEVAQATEVAPTTQAAAEIEAPAVQRGRVLDLDNKPVSGLRIVVEKARGPDAKAEPDVDLRSGAGGEFELPPSLDNRTVSVEDARWVTVFRARVLRIAGFEPTIFVAPRRPLGGVVVDRDGRPIEGAAVELRLEPSVKRNLERRLDGAYRVNFEGKSDAFGRFELSDAPACAGKLHAEALGFASADVEPPEVADTGLKIVLGPLTERHALVRGIVVDSNRAPVEKAFVSVGVVTQETAADGRFEFDLDLVGSGAPLPGGAERDAHEPHRLFAAKPGSLPDEVDLPDASELRADASPREFTLVLSGVPLEIRGRVIDADGNAVSGARVRVLDEGAFGKVWTKVGEVAYTRDVTFEELLRGGPGYEGPTARGDGSFEIRGLRKRSYDIAALDPATLRYAVVRAVTAGREGVVIELDSAKSLQRVAGRIVSRAGEPLADVSVSVGRAASTESIPDFVRASTTGADGRFDLGALDPSGLRLQLTGSEIFFLMAWAPPKDAHLDELEIAVSRRCSVRLELDERTSADAFALLDAQGERVQLFQFEGPVMMMPERGRIADGRSEVYAAEETARTLVLFKDGVELARLPAQLTAGDVTVLRP